MFDLKCCVSICKSSHLLYNVYVQACDLDPEYRSILVNRILLVVFCHFVIKDSLHQLVYIIQVQFKYLLLLDRHLHRIKYLHNDVLCMKTEG